MFQQNNMQYRRFGNSGLKIPVVSLGIMVNSETTVDNLVDVMSAALKNGMNHFDTAQLYSLGENQKMLGEALQKIGEDRANLVISTKVWISPDADMNSRANTNRKHIKEAVKGSLKRLKLDYVDVIYAHGFDYDSPLEEICRAFHEVIEEGDAFYWATSNWDADRIFSAFEICEKYSLHKPIGAQNYYNMVNRLEAEQEYRTLFEKYNYGLVGYAALMGGLLTGKYIEGGSEEGRYNKEKVANLKTEMMRNIYLGPFDVDKINQNLKEVKKIADTELSCTLAQLAVAWVIKFKHTSSSMVGAKSVAQLEETLKAIDFVEKLTPEVEGRINKIMNTHPPARTQWKQFRPEPHVRPLAE